jgi:hypothetical protein
MQGKKVARVRLRPPAIVIAIHEIDLQAGNREVIRNVSKHQFRQKRIGSDQPMVGSPPKNSFKTDHW